jgi:pyruvate dehydrogenase (quinone)
MAISFKVNGEWWSGECRCAAGYAAALAHDGPALVDVVWTRPEPATPPAVTAARVKGFTLYMVKAVMSSRGDELLDLARTNLWR